MPAYSNKWRMGISATAVLALAAVVGLIYLLIALDANRESDAAARARDRQIAVLALAQRDYSINRSVCGFRALANGQLVRARQAVKDPRTEAGARQRSRAAIKQLRQFLDTQVTSPPSFDCRTLPSKPPKKGDT